MPRSWLRPAAVALPLLFAACVPARFTGYRPAGDGRLEGGFCVAGIRDRLRIRAPAGVELLVYTLPHGYRAAALLNVELAVPAGATAQWLSPQLSLHSPAWMKPQTWMIDRIIHGSQSHAATAVLAGSSTPRVRSYRLTFYSTGLGTLAEPAIPPASAFTLELPALQVNAVSFQPLPVRFETYQQWGLYTCVQ